jgi:hypothetical protein
VKQNPNMSQRLILLYDADPGIAAAFLDAGKRLMNDPSTCALYRLTHGFLFEKRAWTEFLARQPIPAEYAHGDFQGLHGAPAVLKDQDGSIAVILSSEDILKCANLDDLMKKIEAGVLTSFAG